MKICMLSELFYPYMSGGAERRYYEIAKRLAKKHEVTVYSLRLFGRKDTDCRNGITIKRIGVNHPVDRRSILPLASFFPALLKSISEDYDIIDANQGMASFIGYLKYLSRRPVVATFHDIYWNKWGEYFNFPLSSAGKLMEFALSKGRFDRIIANSPETKQKLELLGFRSEIEVIVSGIDTDFIEKINHPKENHSIVYAGRLVKYKNIELLIRTAAKLKDEFPKLKLTILGSGPEESSLKSLAKNVGLDAKFLGFVGEKEKIKTLKSSSIFVNPSLVEGLGLILIEAMACKTAVVAQNLDCYFFCDKNNSILYETEEDLYEALRSLLQNSGLREKISRNGYKTSKMFSWDKTADNIERVYRELVE